MLADLQIAGQHLRMVTTCSIPCSPGKTYSPLRLMSDSNCRRARSVVPNERPFVRSCSRLGPDACFEIDLVPAHAEHFGRPRAGHQQRANNVRRLPVGCSASAAVRRANSLARR